MLCDISDLNQLFEEESIEMCMQKTVDMVAEHMMAEVCSIYLYSEAEKKLTLRATRGLKKEADREITMQLGEGLVGTAMKELRVIREDVGKDNPHFKFFPGIGEEHYDAFLAVPIARGRYRIGVLVVQREKKKHFAENDIKALRATASQLATMLENIQLISSSQAAVPAGEKNFSFFSFIKGKGTSSGSSWAPSLVVGAENPQEFFSKEIFNDPYTSDDFEQALHATEKQLEDLQERVEEKLSDAASLIFASHLIMLKDRGFIGGIREMISQGENPPSAIVAIYMKYRDIFSQSPNALIREKVQDIEDITRRLLDNLLEHTPEEDKLQGHIIIVRELFPSDMLKLSAEDIAGIVFVGGGVTSHVAILARSLELPMVIIEEGTLLSLPPGTPLLIDSDTGNIYINPTDDVIATFREGQKAKTEVDLYRDTIEGTPRTSDGHPVPVMLNINLLSDLKRIPTAAIDGIGLYRTEFPFMIRNSFPSEEEQFVIYTKLMKSLEGKPVTFRTLDIGGDKILSYYEFPKEDNPFLGMRSIRFSLQHRDIFKQQIRAILRAGAGKNIRIMFPMISSLEEFASAREIVEECITELKNEKADYNDSPDLGMMVEIPSVVPIIDELAAEVDFFSIGTNDLIQYILAVDRTNAKVAEMYIPHHPAVLRSIALIAGAAQRRGIDVSICGDMGGRPAYLEFLLGVGITSLSVDARFVPRVKEAITRIDISSARKKAEVILQKKRIRDIEEVIFGNK